MKKLILFACVFILSLASCDSEKSEDEVNVVEKGNFIEAYYIEPFEVESASIQEVKNYMNSVAPELYITETSMKLNGSYLNYSLVYQFIPIGTESSELKYGGCYMYNFTGKDMANMELESVSCFLPTYKMCYQGLSKEHSIRSKGEDLGNESVVFNLREGIGQVILTKAKYENYEMGYFVVQLGR